MNRDIIDQGSFYVPHCIYDDSYGFNKNSRGVLCALFACQDMFLFKTKGDNLREWFNVSNDELCKKANISYDTLSKYRRTLIELDLIDYKRGYKGRNSDYRILLDNFYLANKYLKEGVY